MNLSLIAKTTLYLAVFAFSKSILYGQPSGQVNVWSACAYENTVIYNYGDVATNSVSWNMSHFDGTVPTKNNDEWFEDYTAHTVYSAAWQSAYNQAEQTHTCARNYSGAPGLNTLELIDTSGNSTFPGAPAANYGTFQWVYAVFNETVDLGGGNQEVH